jgi:glycosyltransferase involved in cell wall biosynthesis
VSSARNDAMGMCEGEFVAFLDADDRWLADHLQRKVRVLRDSGADLSYSRVEMYDSETGDAMCEWGPTNYELEHFPDSLFGRPYLQPSGVLVRRSLIEDVGHFDSKLAYAEDYDYWFRAVEAGKRFEFDEKVTSRYRKNHASAATTDRLVLCYQGVAEVGGRHVAKIEGDSNARRAIVARHFYAAAAGHMGFIPTERNRCRPEAAPALFEQAWKLGGHAKKNYRGYLWLARFAMKVRAPWLVRRYFEGKFRRINGS